MEIDENRYFVENVSYDHSKGKIEVNVKVARRGYVDKEFSVISYLNIDQYFFVLDYKIYFKAFCLAVLHSGIAKEISKETIHKFLEILSNENEEDLWIANQTYYALPAYDNVPMWMIAFATCYREIWDHLKSYHNKNRMEEQRHKYAFTALLRNGIKIKGFADKEVESLEGSIYFYKQRHEENRSVLNLSHVSVYNQEYEATDPELPEDKLTKE